MLKNLGLEFDGRQHSGFDDAFNVARIAQKMMNDGFTLKINDSLNNPIDGNPVDSFYVKYKGLQNPNHSNPSQQPNNTNDANGSGKNNDSGKS